MIRINLLPPEFETAQAKREQQVLFGGAGGVVALFLLIFWFAKTREAAALQQQVAQAEAELGKFQAIVSQIEKIEADKRVLSAKRDLIRNLNRSRLIYPVFFEDLLPIIPADVWVTNIQIADRASGPMRITMNASALSNFAVATWLTNLQMPPNHFSNVELSAISYATNESGQTLSFTLSCTYQHQGAFPLSEFN